MTARYVTEQECRLRGRDTQDIRIPGFYVFKPGEKPIGPLEKCLVCGHYHGGQGGCVIAHAFVLAVDCPKCQDLAVRTVAKVLASK